MRRPRLLALLTFLLPLLPGTVWSQVDTNAQLLQSPIFGTAPWRKIPIYNLNQLTYTVDGNILGSESSLTRFGGERGMGASLFSSTDGGRTFATYDSLEDPSFYILSHGATTYRLRAYDFAVSLDNGETWQFPEMPASTLLGFQPTINCDPTGKRVNVYSCSGHVASLISTTSYGAYWTQIWVDSTKTFISGNAEVGVSAWASVDDGALIYHEPDNDYAGRYLEVTSDGGVHWRRALDSTSQYYTLFSNASLEFAHPFANVLVVWTQGNSLVSLDTGRTWKVMTLPEHIEYPAPNDWVAATAYRAPPLFSTDTGKTWKSSVYSGPHPITLVSFKDSVNGIGSDGISIVARTTDGGKTWITLDNSDYAFGTIVSSQFVKDEFYAYRFGVSPMGGVLFRSTDRGATWRELSSTLQGSLFVPQGDGYWTGDANSITYVIGNTSNQRNLNGRPGAFVTPIDKGFAWAGNNGDLAYTSDNGLTWSSSLAQYLPGQGKDSSYTFFPMDRRVVYVRTPDSVYVTSTQSSSWRYAAAMPYRALDAEHWFATVNDSIVSYTADGGETFKTVTLPANASGLYPVDSTHWYVGGFSTSDAGTTWVRIPGWDSRLGLHVVDASTAFGQPDSLAIWRLDLPFGSTSLSVRTIASPGDSPSDALLVTNGILSLPEVSSSLQRYRIVDALGREVQQGELAVGSHSIAVQGLANGSYFLVGTSEGPVLQEYRFMMVR